MSASALGDLREGYGSVTPGRARVEHAPRRREAQEVEEEQAREGRGNVQLVPNPKDLDGTRGKVHDIRTSSRSECDQDAGNPGAPS